MTGTLDRDQVADALDEIAVLLELKGENPFKSRAYANAARIIRGLDRDLGELVETGEIRKLKGIGEALAEKISTLVRTGRLPYLEQLRREVPTELVEWLQIPGLGPKRARAIHEALGIRTLGELEYACRENRLRDLEGFGPTIQQKILEGIERLRRHAGRFLQPVVQQAAQALLERVLGAPGVRRAEVAGSVRRRLETSKDIDLVAACDGDTTAVMDAFAGTPEVAEVTGRGPTRASVRLASGPGADLRVVPDASYPFALMYFTGSKAHNIEMRARAQQRGYKLNEYALTREDDGTPVPCADEAAIYAALGLSYIPPELREGLGEIQLAEKGAIPRLVETGDLRGILHCHSTWSDGTAGIRRMADAARAMGMEYLGICDHSQSAAYAGGLDPAALRRQHEEIDALNAEFGDAFRVLKGSEVDILPDGSLDYPDEVLDQLELVIASVHSRFNLPRDQQTRRIIRAIENPRVHILGHPTGRLLLARDGYDVDLRRILERAIELGVVVELNAHPQRLDLDWRELRWAVPRGLMTSINPDAHSVEGLEDIRYGVGIARKGGCTADDVLNTRPLEDLLAILERRRSAGPGPGSGGRRRRRRGGARS